MDNNELMHHGVKGMKWGVRRYQKKDGSLTALGRYKQYKTNKQRKKNLEKAREAKAAKKKAATQPVQKKKSVKEMSDAELQSAIRRLEMEQRYNQLSPKKVSKGKKAVDAILNDMAIPVAKDVGKQLLKSGAVKATNKLLIEKYFGEGSEYKVYTNNKK